MFVDEAGGSPAGMTVPSDPNRTGLRPKPEGYRRNVRFSAGTTGIREVCGFRFRGLDCILVVRPGPCRWDVSVRTRRRSAPHRCSGSSASSGAGMRTRTGSGHPGCVNGFGSSGVEAPPCRIHRGIAGPLSGAHSPRRVRGFRFMHRTSADVVGTNTFTKRAEGGDP